jgi:hypothetical protein
MGGGREVFVAGFKDVLDPRLRIPVEQREPAGLNLDNHIDARGW